MNKSELIAKVARLEAQVKKLKSQSSIADRIMEQRAEYRGSMLVFCKHCGLTPIVQGDTCSFCRGVANIDTMMARWKAEEVDDWRGLCRSIPPFQFPPHWTVKMQMPFGGAAARFLVCLDNEKFISVYFDALDSLGHFGKPYWELCENEDGDTERYAAGDEKGLIKAINRIIKHHEK